MATNRDQGWAPGVPSHGPDLRNTGMQNGDMVVQPSDKIWKEIAEDRETFYQAAGHMVIDLTDVPRLAEGLAPEQQEALRSVYERLLHAD